MESRASCCCGFILEEEHLLKLLFALLRRQNPESKPDPQKTSLNEDDFRTVSYLMWQWLEDTTSPFRFTAQMNQDESRELPKQMALTYCRNKDRNDEDGIFGMELSNCSDMYTLFKAMPWTSEKITRAKEACEDIKKDPVFEDAGITDLVPQLILVLSAD